jgi:hypothetical protein
VRLDHLLSRDRAKVEAARVPSTSYLLNTLGRRPVGAFRLKPAPA